MYTVGLLVDYLEMSYTNRVIQGCIRGAKESGINLILYPGSALKEDRDVSLEQAGTERYSGRTTFHRNILYEFAVAEDSAEVSAEELAESVRAIAEAMQNFDLERADAEMAKMKHMKIPPFLETDFELLKDGVLNFKIEETVALSHDICNKLV